MARRIIRVPGTLSSKCGDIWRVDLEVTTIGVHRQSGIEDERIWKLEIAPCNVPDGEYILGYFLLTNRTEYVRVENGVCWHTRNGSTRSFAFIRVLSRKVTYPNWLTS